jgi:protein involved in polysaccharide export with SLBB domain
MKKWRVIGLCGLFLLLVGCAGGKGTGVSQVAYPELKPPPPGPVVLPSYRILKGDTLAITFPRNPELNLKPVVVRPDGRIDLNLAGEVTAYGRTIPELKKAIAGRYRNFIKRTGYGKVLEPNDYFDLKFVYNPELNIGVRIQPDGKVSLPLVGEVQAADLTPAQLRRELIAKYSHEVRQPDIAVLTGVQPNSAPKDIAAKYIFTQGNFITVALVKSAGRFVFVGGEVKRPSPVPWEGHLTPLQAIMAAGGFTDKADLARVVIVRHGSLKQSAWLRTDLASPLEGKDVKNDVVLQPGDIVVVPKTTIAKIGVFVQQYLRDTIPLYGTYNISLGSASGVYAAPIP